MKRAVESRRSEKAVETVATKNTEYDRNLDFKLTVEKGLSRKTPFKVESGSTRQDVPLEMMVNVFTADQNEDEIWQRKTNRDVERNNTRARGSEE